MSLFRRRRKSVAVVEPISSDDLDILLSHVPGDVGMRPCHICGQVDDGPRHAIAQPIITGQEQALYHHRECCAAQGCQMCILTLEAMNGR